MAAGKPEVGAVGCLTLAASGVVGTLGAIGSMFDLRSSLSVLLVELLLGGLNGIGPNELSVLGGAIVGCWSDDTAGFRGRPPKSVFPPSGTETVCFACLAIGVSGNCMVGLGVA